MTILYGFKLDANGRMIDRLFDHDKLPPDWYDSPDKVPGSPEYIKRHAIETADHQEPYRYETMKIEGSIDFPPVQHAMKRGRPKGSKNKVTHV